MPAVVLDYVAGPTNAKGRGRRRKGASGELVVVSMSPVRRLPPPNKPTIALLGQQQRSKACGEGAHGSRHQVRRGGGEAEHARGGTGRARGGRAGAAGSSSWFGYIYSREPDNCKRSLSVITFANENEIKI